MNEKLLWQNDDEKKQLVCQSGKYKAVLEKWTGTAYDCDSYRVRITRPENEVVRRASTDLFFLIDWTEANLIALSGEDDGAEHEHQWYSDAAHNVFCNICGLEKPE